MSTPRYEITSGTVFDLKDQVKHAGDGVTNHVTSASTEGAWTTSDCFCGAHFRYAPIKELSRAERDRVTKESRS